MVSGSRIARSKVFGQMQSRARAMLDDPKRLRALTRAATAKLAGASADPLRQVADQVRTLIRLVKAYAKGDYREISRTQIATIVGALVYLVSPIDVIADFLPGGFLDDAALLTFVLRSVQTELTAFAEWERRQPIDVEAIDPSGE